VRGKAKQDLGRERKMHLLVDPDAEHRPSVSTTLRMTRGKMYWRFVGTEAPPYETATKNQTKINQFLKSEKKHGIYQQIKMDMADRAPTK
jgi:hypothetical protein